jgi:AraC family transcriptional regulator of adaptative response/methylated-DNA-[protein]-cysteine methyltransferase
MGGGLAILWTPGVAAPYRGHRPTPTAPFQGGEFRGLWFDRNRRDVALPACAYIQGMTHELSLPEDAAWAAFEARDRAFDGRLIVAVTTTRIYCKPTCPARRPKREHVEFYNDADAARAAGYRACLRCKPDEVGRDRIAVARAVALIEAAEESVSLDEVAAAVGYAPHHFHRLFKRATGVTPAAYARGLKAKRAAAALTKAASPRRSTRPAIRPPAASTRPPTPGSG